MKNLNLALLLCTATLFLLSHNVFAHAGPHDGDCTLSTGTQQITLQGVLPQSTFANRHYCHIYPELGKLNLQLDFHGKTIKPYPVKLKVLAMSSISELLSKPDSVFNRLISERDAIVDQAGKINIEVEINERGLYSLEIILQQANAQPDSHYFLLLVGIPTTKILIGFCGLLFLFLLITGRKTENREQRTKD